MYVNLLIDVTDGEVAILFIGELKQPRSLFFYIRNLNYLCSNLIMSTYVKFQVQLLLYVF